MNQQKRNQENDFFETLIQYIEIYNGQNWNHQKIKTLLENNETYLNGFVKVLI